MRGAALFSRVQAVLVANPQLGLAVLQAQVLLGMTPQLVAAATQRKFHEQQQQMVTRQHGEGGYAPEVVAAAFAGLDDEHRMLLARVLTKTNEEIMNMSPEEQEQHLSLREQAMKMLNSTTM